MADRVLDLIATVLDVPIEELTEKASSENVKGWDSAAQLNLGLAIEETFGIELAPDELTNLVSVADIRAILSGHAISK